MDTNLDSSMENDIFSLAVSYRSCIQMVDFCRKFDDEREKRSWRDMKKALMGRFDTLSKKR